jgi:hypothetical protein
MKARRRVSVRRGHKMKSSRTRVLGLLVGLVVLAAIAAMTSRDARAVLPPLPNTVQQWNKIAEDTVVTCGAFQGEGEVYMSYTATAVYDAVVAIQGGYEPYGPAISAPPEPPSTARSSRPRIGRCGIPSRRLLRAWTASTPTPCRP